MSKTEDAQGTEDISGDYDSYSIVESVEINDFKVELRGDENGYRSVVFHDSKRTFAISVKKGLKKEKIIDIVKSIK